MRRACLGQMTLVSSEGGHHYSPRWFPGGRQIVYTAQAGDGDHFDIEMIDLDTGLTEPVIATPETESEASWQPMPGPGSATPNGLR